MGALFPKFAPDGSFRVRAVFAAVHQLDRSALQEWLHGWVESNETWEFFGELHRFGDCFAAPPSVEETPELAIRFTGIPNAPKLWKDWFVRIIIDAQKRFPSLGELQHVKDA